MEQQSRIQPLTGGSGKPYSITFSPQEVTAIDEMIGVFGGGRDEVVFKAVSLLYTLFQEDPNVEAIFIQKGTKRVVIPLK